MLFALAISDKVSLFLIVTDAGVCLAFASSVFWRTPATFASVTLLKRTPREPEGLEEALARDPLLSLPELESNTTSPNAVAPAPPTAPLYIDFLAMLRVTVCDLASCFVNSEMALPDLFEVVVDFLPTSIN